MKKILGILSLITVASSVTFAAATAEIDPKLNVIDIADAVLITPTTTNIDLGKIVIVAGVTPPNTGSTNITVTGLLNKTATIKIPLTKNLTGAATLATSNTLTGLTGGTDTPDATSHVIVSDAVLGDGTANTSSVAFTLNSAITTQLTGSEAMGVCTGLVPITAYWN